MTNSTRNRFFSEMLDSLYTSSSPNQVKKKLEELSAMDNNEDQRISQEEVFAESKRFSKMLRDKLPNSIYSENLKKPVKKTEYFVIY